MVLGRLVLGCVLCVVVSSVTVEQDAATYSIYQTPEKITADGFTPETHKVTTSDGYILEMHRVLLKTSDNNRIVDRPVVFLMHGLLSASQSFVLLGPAFSFAYNLVDAGFDVWMGNARGNKNSRFHTSLNPDDEDEKLEFFDFSFEEIGMFDLPAMIDYILDHTKTDKLHYVGHSQGGTVFLVMATMLPEYNQKIISAHLLAGVGYQDYFPNAELSGAALLTDYIYSESVKNGHVELYPPGATEMIPGGILDGVFPLSDYCLGNPLLSYMCQLFGIRHILPTRNSAADTDQPGAALKQIAHYGQNIRDKLFRRFHYGAEENQIRYGSPEPPRYDLSLITTFVTMHYTLSDNLLDEKDVLAMVADIPNAIARQVERTTFLHADFVTSTDAKVLVTDYIIEAIQNAGQGGTIVDGGTTTTSDPIITVTSPPEITEGTTEDPIVTITSPPEDTECTTQDSVTITSPPEDTVTPTPEPDGAVTIVMNVYLMLLSLYVMLK